MNESLILSLSLLLLRATAPFDCMFPNSVHFWSISPLSFLDPYTYFGTVSFVFPPSSLLSPSSSPRIINVVVIIIMDNDDDDMERKAGGLRRERRERERGERGEREEREERCMVQVTPLSLLHTQDNVDREDEKY